MFVIGLFIYILGCLSSVSDLILFYYFDHINTAGGHEPPREAKVFIFLQQLLVMKAEVMRGGMPFKNEGNFLEITIMMLQTDLHEEVCWGEDPKTDGEKGPALHTTRPVPVVHQLLTDLAVNLIPAQAEKHEGKAKTVTNWNKQKEGTEQLVHKIQENFQEFTR